MRPKSITDPGFQQAFFAHMIRNPSGCLEWQGSKNKLGYGRINIEGKVQKAHRIAWIIANGPIPDGMCVLHHCDNPPCCEPSHLFLGTIADNNADMVAKGRAFKFPAYPGEQHSRAKLTVNDVHEIREIYQKGSREFGTVALARRFGVGQSQIARIILGQSWHLTPPSLSQDLKMSNPA